MLSPSTVAFWQRELQKKGEDVIMAEKLMDGKACKRMWDEPPKRFMNNNQRKSLLDKINTKMVLQKSSIYTPRDYSKKVDPKVKEVSEIAGGGPPFIRLCKDVASRFDVDALLDVTYEELAGNGKFGSDMNKNMTLMVQETYDNLLAWYGEDIKETLFITMWPKLRRFFTASLFDWYKAKKSAGGSGGSSNTLFPNSRYGG